MKLVKAHGNAKLAKGPRNFKESKWAKDAQKKNKGTQEPISKKNQWSYQATGKKSKRLA